MKLTLRQDAPYKSIKILNTIDLPDFTVITGLNGSGKTQLLQAIYFSQIIPYDDETNMYSNDNSYLKNGNVSSIYVNFKGQISNSNEFSSDNQDKLKYIEIIKELNTTGIIPYQRQQYGQNAPIPEFIIRTVKKAYEISNIDFKDFTYKDLLVFKSKFVDESNLFSLPNLSEIIVAYYEKKKENSFKKFQKESEGIDTKYLNDIDFIKMYGQDPVEVFNKYLRMLNEKYRIVRPEYNDYGTPYEARMINDKTGDYIRFSDLSTGESVFFQLISTLFNYENCTLNIPKIILLDEMDAGLHPSLTKQLLEDIKRIFIDEMKLKVIMTTHSPTTVALCEEESIYMMSDEEPRLRKISKQEALNLLTIGIPTLNVDYDCRKQVIVESKYDAKNYEKIYSILRDNNKIIDGESLTFISSGGDEGGSCTLVQSFVTGFRENGNNKIYGIIDWDKKNQSQDYINCLAEGKRYSIENCILDPLILSCLLLIDGFGEKYVLPIKKISEINSNSDLYQAMLDTVIKQLDIELKELVTCNYIGNFSLNIPKEFLIKNGHKLDDIYRNKIPELKKYKNNNELIDRVLTIFASYVDMIPKELIEVFNFNK